MSRFSEYDGDDDDSFNGNGGYMWEKRAQLALEGKRGRAALADLRDALLALPQKQLIEGALCTVGLEARLTAIPEEVERTVEPIARNEDGSIKRDAEGHVMFEPIRTELVENYEREEFGEFVARHEGQPEGVCAIGAYVWWQKVKSGMAPAEAFAALPTIPDIEGGDYATADIGKEYGLTYTLAWELASRNDEQWGGLTPEQRYVAFVTWIDQQLAKPPLRAPERGRKAELRAAREAARAGMRAHEQAAIGQDGLGL